MEGPGCTYLDELAALAAGLDFETFVPFPFGAAFALRFPFPVPLGGIWKGHS